jgi:hypothetical protein
MLTLGIGTGLVAYYVGLPAAFSAAQGGPDELQLVPGDASFVLNLDVRQLMASELRDRARQMLSSRSAGSRQFEVDTGINVETDVDRVVAFLSPPGASPPARDQALGGGLQGEGVVMARGRFDQARIETALLQRGGEVAAYKGRRLIDAGAQEGVSLAFVEPGLLAAGSTAAVRRTIDLNEGGGNLTGNETIMELIRPVRADTLWAVGHLDALRSQTVLPPGVTGQLPAITWFSISGRVSGGIAGQVRATTRDEQSAEGLRDVVRGIIALGGLQAASRPELETALRALKLGGTGTTVLLEFQLPLQLIDSLPSSIPDVR